MEIDDLTPIVGFIVAGTIVTITLFSSASEQTKNRAIEAATAIGFGSAGMFQRKNGERPK